MSNRTVIFSTWTPDVRREALWGSDRYWPVVRRAVEWREPHRTLVDEETIEGPDWFPSRTHALRAAAAEADRRNTEEPRDD